MKIVDTKTLITMPEGTVYLPVPVNPKGISWLDDKGKSVHAPAVLPEQYGGLFIKQEACFYNGEPSDWYYTDLLSCDKEEHACWELDEEGKLDPSGGRDGMYEYNRYFMVFDDEDTLTLIEALVNRKSTEA